VDRSQIHAAPLPGRQVYVELPLGWGDARVISTSWAQAGYRVDEERYPATGERRLIIRGRPT
jgi:hypothetical protein